MFKRAPGVVSVNTVLEAVDMFEGAEATGVLYLCLE